MPHSDASRQQCSPSPEEHLTCLWLEPLPQHPCISRPIPDGTIVWTSPTGHTYSTQAHGGMLCFPRWLNPPAIWVTSQTPDASLGNGVLIRFPPRR
jgi:hypothetical protein